MPPVTDAAATVVLVHGAWHGAWCWNAVGERLTAAGVPWATVDNPSVAKAPSTLVDDGDNVTRLLDEIGAPVVLVGHSYGGAVITDAGAHANVRELVYLSSFALDAGETLNENGLTGGEAMTLPEALRFDGDVVSLDPERVVDLFFHDCAPDVAAAAAAQLAPMSIAAMGGVPRAVAWREKPATYVVCTDDRALPVPLQQSNAARIGTTVEMAASHSPFLSRPDDVAALLVSLSRA
jgi:pimeloyl-ACP methyl ester carboxylesterase